MPVDTTRIIATRRTQKNITQEELKDIELKRIRGELSCAECRRLKLRCDKKVPCSSCVRRGCESICPCGILSAGQGSRFILADTDQLHKKISEMSNRIRQLEDALAILQATVSDKPHALLSDDHMRIKFGSEAILPKTEEEDAREAPLDALGTLTLEDSGESRFFGRSAGVETLMMASESPENSPIVDESEILHFPLTSELENLSNRFPFTRLNMSDTAALRALEVQLPSRERACSLAQYYIDHASYFYRPVKQEELFECILQRAYPSPQSSTQLGGAQAQQAQCPEGQNVSDGLRPHELATLFFIFALGALLDLNLPPYNAEGEHFYELGRAALSLKAVYESPSIDTVRAMGLMATYHCHAGRKYSRDSAWCIMSFAAKMAQSIGLHRDGARWMMDPATVRMRRNLFWETFAADVSHSLALGRPPAIHLSYVDCEFPLDEEAIIDETGKTQDGFWRMKHLFAKDIFYALAEATLVARTPSYQTILDLDRKVRETPFSSHFRPYLTREEGEEEFYSSSLSLRGFYACQHRPVTMLYLHRSFFAQAVLDHPTNPLLSPFAPSFLTAYRCASVIIRAAAHQFERCAPISMRIWFLLCHTFSAAVIVGTVVTRSPNSAVAASALLDLDVAIELFEKTTPQSYRARVALSVLRKLKEKAVVSYNESCSSIHPAQTSGVTSHLNPQVSGLFSVHSLRDAEDELALFGGQARLLTRKSKYKPADTGSLVSSSEHTTPPESLSSSPKSSPPSNVFPMPDVHPSLIEYLQHDTTRQSRMQPYPHSMANSVSNPPPPSSSNHVGSRKSAHPPTREVGEMYSSFMGYIASKSISNIPSAPGVVPPSMRDYRPPQTTQSNGAPGRRNSRTNMASPSAISGGWEQSSGRSVPRQNLPRHDPSNASSGYATEPADANALNSWMALNPANAGFSSNQYFSGLDSSPTNGLDNSALMTSPQSQGGIGGAAYNSRSDAMAFQGFGVDPSYLESNFLPGPAPFAPNQNTMDPMVEMGLTTGGGMDEGWLSFMRECGIMENGRPPQL